jgi:plastocyanin
MPYCRLSSMHLKHLMVATMVLGGCGGGDGGGPSPTTVIAKTSGDAQDGVVGQALAKPIQVLVSESNAPVAGATVTWSTTLTGATLTPASGPTDGDGLASTQWTLGPLKGLQTATATVNGATTTSVNFTATASAGAPVALTEVTGDNQAGMIDALLGQIAAIVTDQFDNPIPGVEVAWSASGATVAAATEVTNSAGISFAQVTLGGTPGPVSITAVAAGLANSPLTFNAIAEAVPTQAEVHLGNIFFSSDRNNSTNPAVDTLAVGGTVTWTWGNTGIAEHSVRSLGSPGFTSSATKLGNGQTYSVTFANAGTYSYDCAVHGSQMTGRIVVR